MRIEESSVVLESTHRATLQQSEETAFEGSFRTVFQEVDAAMEPQVVNRGQGLRRAIHQLLQEMLDRLCGKQCRCRQLQSALPSAESGAPRGAVERVFDWEAVRKINIQESESVTFSAQGSVRTRDGVELQFAVGMALARASETTRLQIAGGETRWRDPLMLVFDGTAAELNDVRFDFDLDADGSREMLATPGKGCGFLAWDRDGSGSIDNGEELFGARSGDGFADLAAFDEDGNGWIDAGDTIFSQLGIWRPPEAVHEPASDLAAVAPTGGQTGPAQAVPTDEAGDGRRAPGTALGWRSLTARGIGALYLGQTQTPFMLVDGQQDAQGRIRASGVYLREDGRPGILQQIDLAI